MRRKPDTKIITGGRKNPSYREPGSNLPLKPGLLRLYNFPSRARESIFLQKPDEFRSCHLPQGIPTAPSCFLTFSAWPSVLLKLGLILLQQITLLSSPISSSPTSTSGSCSAFWHSVRENLRVSTSPPPPPNRLQLLQHPTSYQLRHEQLSNVPFV